MNMKEMF